MSLIEAAKQKLAKLSLHSYNNSLWYQDSLLKKHYA